MKQVTALPRRNTVGWLGTPTQDYRHLEKRTNFFLESNLRDCCTHPERTNPVSRKYNKQINQVLLAMHFINWNMCKGKTE